MSIVHLKGNDNARYSWYCTHLYVVSIPGNRLFAVYPQPSSHSSLRIPLSRRLDPGGRRWSTSPNRTVSMSCSHSCAAAQAGLGMNSSSLCNIGHLFPGSTGMRHSTSPQLPFPLRQCTSTSSTCKCIPRYHVQYNTLTTRLRLHTKSVHSCNILKLRMTSLIMILSFLVII